MCSVCTSLNDKKKEDLSGVVALFKKLIADAKKDSLEAQTPEKRSQEQCEEFMAESCVSRADKVQGDVTQSITTEKLTMQSVQSSASTASKAMFQSLSALTGAITRMCCSRQVSLTGKTAESTSLLSRTMVSTGTGTLPSCCQVT